MKKNLIFEKMTSINESEVDTVIDKLVKTQSAISIGFLNQHGYNLLCKSHAVKSDFLNLDYLFRDGIGIKIACKVKNIEAGANLNGTDLIPRIIHQINSYKKSVVYFVYGTQSPWLEQGTENLLCKDSHKIDGFQKNSVYMDHFKVNQKNNALNVIILAMGMPKQEFIAHKLKSLSTGSTIIICGGAIIDFKANRFRRAPELFKKTGMEWLFRFLSEPRRLFKRYILGIPIFFYNILTSR